MAQKINDTLFVNKAGVLDAKYGPWSSIEEMLSEVDVQYRDIGLTFGVRDETNRVVEYWFQGGVLAEHVEPKYESSEYTSTWIRKPVISIVEALPAEPEDSDRYIHEHIIKEFVGAVWVDRVGGDGIALVDGMAVVVNQVDGWPNMIYIYHVDPGEWKPFIPLRQLHSENINTTRIFQLHFIASDGSVWKTTMNPDGTLNTSVVV